MVNILTVKYTSFPQRKPKRDFFSVSQKKIIYSILPRWLPGLELDRLAVQDLPAGPEGVCVGGSKAQGRQHKQGEDALHFDKKRLWKNISLVRVRTRDVVCIPFSFFYL